MNLRKRLQHLAHISTKDRQTGRTAATCRAAIDIGGIVIAASFEHAKYLTKEFGVIAKSMDINMDGFSGPFLFDHFAVEQLLERAAQKIKDVDDRCKELDGIKASLEAKIKVLEYDLKTVLEKRDALQQALDYYQHGPTHQEVKP